MLITIYAKKRTTREGKSFYSFLTKLVKKGTGETITAQVKFRESCGTPDGKLCPCNLEINKKTANFASKEMTDNDTGLIFTSNTLWVSDWQYSEIPFADTSMDDFEG